MSKVSSWLDDKPTPDAKGMTELELLTHWYENRNSLIGVVMAEEVARRRYRLHLLSLTKESDECSKA